MATVWPIGHFTETLPAGGGVSLRRGVTPGPSTTARRARLRRSPPRRRSWPTPSPAPRRAGTTVRQSGRRGSCPELADARYPLPTMHAVTRKRWRARAPRQRIGPGQHAVQCWGRRRWRRTRRVGLGRLGDDQAQPGEQGEHGCDDEGSHGPTTITISPGPLPESAGFFARSGLVAGHGKDGGRGAVTFTTASSSPSCSTSQTPQEQRR
jgi:hypothetical protein